MEMKNVLKSSNIDAYGYAAADRELVVAFKSGTSYAYHDVPPEIFAALEAAPSKGQYVASTIATSFDFTKLEARASDSEAAKT